MSEPPADETRRHSFAADAAAAAAIRRITATSDAINAISHQRRDKTAAERLDLSLAVGAARGLDISWQTIGDALGMRRGAAYQRFRHRPPSRAFEVQESAIDGVTLLAVRGELDMETAPMLAEAISGALVQVAKGVVVDLCDLAFLSSAGIAALVSGERTARNSEKRFGVVANGPSTSRPLKLLGIDRTLDVYPTVHAAMLGLHRPPAGGSAR